MNPNLDEVARDPAVGPDIDFFWKIPKKLIGSRVGQIFAPNFYYRTRSVQLVFLVPLDNLKSKLPSPLEPIMAFPGYGLVALTFYSYLVCDNDPYNEKFRSLSSSVSRGKLVIVRPSCSAPYGTEPSTDTCWLYPSILRSLEYEAYTDISSPNGSPTLIWRWMITTSRPTSPRPMGHQI
jgi:hypothetical protein